MVEPNEIPPALYIDRHVRTPTPTDLAADHEFRVRFDEKTLSVEVDDFSASFDVATMPKVFGSGLIWFQSYAIWMSLVNVDIE